MLTSPYNTLIISINSSIVQIGCLWKTNMISKKYIEMENKTRGEIVLTKDGQFIVDIFFDLLLYEYQFR